MLPGVHGKADCVSRNHGWECLALGCTSHIRTAYVCTMDLTEALLFRSKAEPFELFWIHEFFKAKVNWELELETCPSKIKLGGGV